MKKNSPPKASEVLIQIVTWNSRFFIENCLNSVFEQTYQDFSVLIIDNASRDKTVDFVREKYGERKNLFIMENARNLGFAAAHNQGFNITQSKFILVLNPDVVLPEDFLKKMTQFMKSKQRLGSCSPKLLKMRFFQDEIKITTSKTKIIDSAGLLLFKNGRIVDRGEGEEDRGQYDQIATAFGGSGACVFYQRRALEDVKMPMARGYEYFDQDFFAYKEDVDLAWRLNLRNWKNFYFPGAQAYHFRAGAPRSRRKKQPAYVNFYSFRNHLWLLIKNLHFSLGIKYFFSIVFYQLSKNLYLFFTQPKVWGQSELSFWRGFSKMLKKRRYILRKAKVPPASIKNWFQ
jgi:GT2 family glycosyltransferase